MRVWNSEVVLLGRSTVVWLLSGIDFVFVLLAELFLLLVALTLIVSRSLEWLISAMIGDSPYHPEAFAHPGRRRYIRSPSLWDISLPIACLRKWTDCLSGRARLPPEFLQDGETQTDEEPPVWEYKVCRLCEERLRRDFMFRSPSGSKWDDRAGSPDSVMFQDARDNRRARTSVISEEDCLDDSRLPPVPERLSRRSLLRTSERHFPLSRRRSSSSRSPVKATISSHSRPASPALTRARLLRKLTQIKDQRSEL